MHLPSPKIKGEALKEKGESPIQVSKSQEKANIWTLDMRKHHESSK
jgi:hypothetical protein